MVYGELGVKSVSEYIENRMVNFWHRLATGNDNKISTLLYKMIKLMYTQNMYLSPWLDKIKKLLDYNGMSNLFEEPGSVNHIWFKEAFKLRINDVNRQKWQEVVHNSSACLTYRIVTVQKDLQYYLINLPVKYAYDLCKFKCGNHKLPIVTGRFQNLAIDERVCRLCQLNDVGDEFHYVLRCPFFQENRKKNCQKILLL